MKKTYLILIISAALLAECSSAYQVKKEHPKSPDLGRYRTIKVGWINYPVQKWQSYGFKSQGEWIKITIDLNRKSLNQYLRESLRGIKVLGSRERSNAIPSKGDLFIKLGFKGIKRNYSTANGGYDYLTVAVEFFDIRSRHKVYSAVVTVSSARGFPHNWKAAHFNGRLDNEVYNLAQFIAGKF